MHNPAILGSAEPLPGDPVSTCIRYFERSIEIARRAGIGDDRLVLDPGLGFGKSPDQNLELLQRLTELTRLGFPLLVGTSRKSFIGKVTGRDNPHRLIGTLVTNIVAALNGAAILRVHDVAEHVEALGMLDAIQRAGAISGGGE
jgi:dihydropteroate synthase